MGPRQSVEPVAFVPREVLNPFETLPNSAQIGSNVIPSSWAKNKTGTGLIALKRNRFLHVRGVEMDVKRRLALLLAGTVVGTSILVSRPAFADEAQLQQQINAMQQQLKALQAQLAETKKQATAAGEQATKAQQEAKRPAKARVSSKRRRTFRQISTPRMCRSRPRGHPLGSTVSIFDGRHVHRDGRRVASAKRERFGRQRSPFSTIPLLNSPLYNENELRFSAQQSRIALKASGDIDPTHHVAGYFEMDFLGGAPTGNSRESNSYNPRIRQPGSLTTTTTGTATSVPVRLELLTQNRVGIINQTENIPLTIDAQYVTGFNWARQPAIRL